MKSKSLSSEPLSNPQHEAFAEEFSLGRNATEAYMKVYGTANRPTAASGGYRLLRRKTIVARIQAFQQAGAAGVALDLRRMHDFLTRVVLTPAGQVLPSSDLCSRVKHTRDGATDVWMPDKLASIRLSAKLQGLLDRPPSARAAAKSANSDSGPIDEPGVMTEERRAVMCQQKHDAMEARLQRQEEERLAQEQQPAQEKRPVEERPILEQEKRQESRPARASPKPAPPEPKPPIWVGPSGRYPYFGMNFRTQPQPAPTVPIIPPPDAEPSPAPAPSARPRPRPRNRPSSSSAAEPRFCETPTPQSGEPETSRPSGQPESPHLAMPPRVTPENSSKNLINSHHPTETTSQGTQPPNPTQPKARGANGSNQAPETRNLKPETPCESPADTPDHVPASEPNPKPETRNQEPDIRSRICREAAIRLRLTGDSTTCDALLVI